MYPPVPAIARCLTKETAFDGRKMPAGEGGEVCGSECIVFRVCPKLTTPTVWEGFASQIVHNAASGVTDQDAVAEACATMYVCIYTYTLQGHTLHLNIAAMNCIKTF